MNSDWEVLVSAWVKIGNTASVDYNVYRDGTVEFSVGGDDAFMLVTTERGLHNFLVHAEEALRAVRAAIAAATGVAWSTTPGKISAKAQFSRASMRA